uniref:Agglutinin n=1 Tax=Clandestinovirus TaxID=2831644 RepID=A0A8F8KT33_9VIRU|nr:agglutinin [Clandestinovirus]
MNAQPNPFMSQPQQSVQSNGNSTGGLVVGLVAGGLVLAGLAAGGYVLYNKMKDETQPSSQTSTQTPQIKTPQTTQTKTSQSAQTPQSKTTQTPQTKTPQTTQAKTTQTPQTKTPQTTQTKTTQTPQTKTGQTSVSTPPIPAPTPLTPVPNVNIGPGNYFIQLHKDPNMVIDIEGGGKTNGAKAIIFSKNGGDNQKFAFIGKTMKAAHSGLVLDADGGLISGRNIQQWQYLGGNNQKWIPYTDGTIRADADPKMCIDVKEGGGQGTNLIAFECHGGDNQTWDIVKAN